ncbi:MAG TPA: hypothetical protein VH108_07890 [Gaiellaceae bacterium]|jgi:hypothetical protein|nr:hypothetical protein [Gaiellaceae bacterium]
MRRLLLLVELAVAVAVLLPGSARPAQGGTDLPFAASMAGHGTVNLVTGQAHNQLVARATQFGLATLEESSQIVPVAPGVFLSIGTLTLTAANGDQMFGSATGTGNTTDGVHFTFSLHAVFSSGTGRFAGASLAYDVQVHSTTVSVIGATATSDLEATAVGRLSH